MHSHIKILIIFFSGINISLNSFSQNLVPNSDFEQTNAVPCSAIPNPVVFSNTMLSWQAGLYGSPDIFSLGVPHTCYSSPYNGSSINYGFQMPRSGEKYVGFYTSIYGGQYREYVTVRLTQPMTIGKRYFVSAYVSLRDNCHWATNVGIHLSDTNLLVPLSVLPLIPQITAPQIIRDTMNWVKISDTLTATSAWEYLTIGNFYDDVSTVIDTNCPGAWWYAYYILDDVSVIPIVSLNEETVSRISEISIYYSGSRIIFNGLDEGKLELNIYSLNGQEVFSDVTNQSGKEFILDKEFPPGIYFVRVTQKKKTDVLKLMIAN